VVTSLFCGLPVRVRRPSIWNIFGGLLLSLSITTVAQSPSDNDSVLKKHYDLAQNFQTSGNFGEAASQYRIFIADALAELAIQSASAENYRKAAPLFDEALRLAPQSPGLRVRYAQAALAADDLLRTRTLTEGIIRDYPGNTKALAKANLLLGRALLKLNDEAAARSSFEAAVALDPNFENGYALAIACLDRDDGASAAKIFAEMVAGLGDTAALHIEIGRAYLNSDFQQEASAEFKKAIAIDDEFPGAHYALAVDYLTIGGDAKLAEANSELEAELKLSPNDASTHSQLGNIALRQHRYSDAERELKQATSLNASDPGPFFYLGQLYSETNRREAAIAAFSQSIALTKDPSSNRYQVQKSHYLLGRLLIQSGQMEAAKKEMQLSSELLKRSLGKDRGRLAGELGWAEPADAADTTLLNTSPGQLSSHQAEAAASLADFETRIAPAIADSYNNLGVIDASNRSTEEALTSFEHAYEWNPGITGLDVNLGLAASRSGRYEQSISPLSRALRSNPTNFELRSGLAVSLFNTKDFSGVLTVLGSATDQTAESAQLAYIYAASLVKTGNIDAGMKRLLAIEQVNPQLANVHTTLGEGYALHKDYARAVAQLQTSIRLNPDNAMAHSLLGSIELNLGELHRAIQSLEMATKLDTNDKESHRLLASAYRKDHRAPDAEREQAIFDTLGKGNAAHVPVTLRERCTSDGSDCSPQ
jgi:tetratricopeptide (TPR) repeat protein